MSSSVQNFIASNNYKSQSSIYRSKGRQALLEGQIQQTVAEGNAKVAQIQGQASKAVAETSAQNAEEKAKSDSHLALRNMKRISESGRKAMAEATVEQSASGLTEQGSGMERSISVADAVEQAISDASLSNAINDSNYRYQASQYRLQGNIAEISANAEADQYLYQGQMAMTMAQANQSSYNAIASGYSKMASIAKTAGIIELGTSLISGGMGAFGVSGLSGALGTSSYSGLQGALVGAYNGSNFASNFTSMMMGSTTTQTDYGNQLLSNFLNKSIFGNTSSFTA